jgi:hypothetical protein
MKSGMPNVSDLCQPSHSDAGCRQPASALFL